MSQRPLSPHLQVYRLPLTALLSISHRFTGVILSVGLIFWSCYLLAAAFGPSAFAVFQAVLLSTPGALAKWCWLYALCFHASHGVRHLIWDEGHRLERKHLASDGIFELGLSLVLFGALALFVATR